VRLSEGLTRLAQVETTAPHLEWISRRGPEAILRGEDAAAPFAPA
jgi:hypothetical protein